MTSNTDGIRLFDARGDLSDLALPAAGIKDLWPSRQ
jgi:hypothetical protein